VENEINGVSVAVWRWQWGPIVFRLKRKVVWFCLFVPAFH